MALSIASVAYCRDRPQSCTIKSSPLAHPHKRGRMPALRCSCDDDVTGVRASPSSMAILAEGAASLYSFARGVIFVRLPNCLARGTAAAMAHHHISGLFVYIAFRFGQRMYSEICHCGGFGERCNIRNSPGNQCCNPITGTFDLLMVSSND